MLRQAAGFGRALDDARLMRVLSRKSHEVSARVN